LDAKTENLNFYLNRAEGLHGKGDLTKALKVYKKASRLFHNDVKIHEGLAKVYTDMGFWGEARRFWQSADAHGDLSSEGRLTFADLEYDFDGNYEFVIGNLMNSDICALDHLLEKAQGFLDTDQPLRAFEFLSIGLAEELESNPYRRLDDYQHLIFPGENPGGMLADVVNEMQYYGDPECDLFNRVFDVLHDAFDRISYGSGAARFVKTSMDRYEEFLDIDRKSVMHQNYAGDNSGPDFQVDVSRFYPDGKVNFSGAIECGS
jgi:tetratricopeptide (TPR) repeat protein